MDLKKLDLKDRIQELEIQLADAKKHTYVHDTNSIHCSDGELYIEYGDPNDEKVLIMNTDQLFKDLPFIINQVVKENKKMQDYYLCKIKDELKELDPDDKTTTKEIPGFEGTLEKLNNL